MTLTEECPRQLYCWASRRINKHPPVSSTMLATPDLLWMVYLVHSRRPCGLMNCGIFLHLRRCCTTGSSCTMTFQLAQSCFICCQCSGPESYPSTCCCVLFCPSNQCTTLTLVLSCLVGVYRALVQLAQSHCFLAKSSECTSRISPALTVGGGKPHNHSGSSKSHQV